MHLRLRRACANGSPRNQVGNVLRRDHVEKLGARRHAHRVDVQQQPARHPQPLVDVETAIELRIVDQPLPAHRRARLLEIHPHHDFQPVGKTPALLHQPRRIIARRHRIVNGTGTDHHQQPVIHAVQNAVDGLARPRHRLPHLLAYRKLANQMRRRDQLGQRENTQIISRNRGIHSATLLFKNGKHKIIKPKTSKHTRSSKHKNQKYRIPPEPPQPAPPGRVKKNRQLLQRWRFSMFSGSLLRFFRPDSPDNSLPCHSACGIAPEEAKVKSGKAQHRTQTPKGEVANVAANRRRRQTGAARAPNREPHQTGGSAGQGAVPDRGRRQAMTSAAWRPPGRSGRFRPFHPPSAPRCAMLAAPRPPARSGHPCRRCRCRGPAPCRCRSSSPASARPARCR